MAGKKCLTSRHKRYNDDPAVLYITPKLRWDFIRDRLYLGEGAGTPNELQETIEDIYNRNVPGDEMFYVHAFDPLVVKERF